MTSPIISSPHLCKETGSSNAISAATGPHPRIATEAEPSGPKVAALYVETNGAYSNLPGVQAWDIARDARLYAGPHPVVCHSPCQRWGRYAESHPIVGRIGTAGDDGGCFKAALAAVRQWGGVLEHPKDSRAWDHFGLTKPTPSGGWVMADDLGGWTCCVDQGWYGHFSNKRTWLYAAGVELPSLIWGKHPQRIHPRALELHGYAKARRIGMMAMVGGKDKTRIRNATPEPFRDLLLSIARSAYELRSACDCEAPEATEGVALVSETCPIHGGSQERWA